MAFRQRYLVDDRVMRYLIHLTKGRCLAESINHTLYFHTAMSDPLIHDFAADFISCKYRAGLQGISHSLYSDLHLRRGEAFAAALKELEESEPWARVKEADRTQAIRQLSLRACLQASAAGRAGML